MDWKTIVKDLRACGLTYQQIADYAEMSKGGLHDLGSGHCKSVLYERGELILRLHGSTRERAKALKGKQ